jgi:hypothetical protein
MTQMMHDANALDRLQLCCPANPALHAAGPTCPKQSCYKCIFDETAMPEEHVAQFMFVAP